MVLFFSRSSTSKCYENRKWNIILEQRISFVNLGYYKWFFFASRSSCQNVMWYRKWNIILEQRISFVNLYYYKRYFFFLFSSLQIVPHELLRNTAIRAEGRGRDNCRNPRLLDRGRYEEGKFVMEEGAEMRWKEERVVRSSIFSSRFLDFILIYCRLIIPMFTRPTYEVDQLRSLQAHGLGSVQRRSVREVSELVRSILPLHSLCTESPALDLPFLLTAARTTSFIGTGRPHLEPPSPRGWEVL